MAVKVDRKRQLIESLVGSTAMRGFLFRSLKHCNACGTSHLNAALARIGGHDDSTLCVTGKLYYYALYGVSKALLRIASIDDEIFLKEVTGDVAYRRGAINLLTGLARYGLRHPMIADVPFLVVWDWTRKCNLKCVHCYSNAGIDFAKLPIEEGGDLSFEQRKEVIDQLADAGVVILAFSGGEPMMADRFWELARYAKDRGFKLAMASNGTLIKDVETAQRLKEVGIQYIEISLDHVNPEIHDEFRGVQGAWDRAVRGIKNASAAGIYTVVATTLTKKNYDEGLEKLLELRKEWGAQNNLFFNFVPTGRGKDIIMSDLSPEEREHAMDIIYTSMSEVGCGFTTAPQYARYTLTKLHEKGEGPVAISHFAVVPPSYVAEVVADLIGGCGVGRFYCSIEANGDMQPCVFMPITLGNVLKEGFRNIWDNHPVLKTLRTRKYLKGYCAHCEFKKDCGGCRSRAWGYFGDLNAPDPGCIRNRKYWEQLKEAVLTEDSGTEKAYKPTYVPMDAVKDKK
ncbi:MAG: radical SAM protein [Candidatus Hermodarchaeota archaeon]